MESIVHLAPAVGQRLIAKAIASFPKVQEAFASETLVVNAGTTTVLVYFELTGKLPEGAMAAGLVVPKGPCSDGKMREFLLKNGYGASWVFKKGELLSEYKLQTVVREFSEKDVFIKGANAIDPTGLSASYCASERYGTIQLAMPVILAKGAHLIVPVSLEKAILGSTMRNAQKMGIRRLDYIVGLPMGYMPIVGHAVTEVDALKTLFGLDALHVGAGDLLGEDGGESFLVTGGSQQFESLREMIELCRKEDIEIPVQSGAPLCGDCRHSTCVEKNYNFERYVAAGM